MGLPTHLFTAIDHVGIAVPRPRRGDRASTRETFGMRLAHEEINEEQGVREAMIAVGDSGLVHPAARAARRRTRRSRSSSTAPGPGSSSWPTGSPTSRRSARSCASAGCGCCTTSRAAAPRTRGSTSSTPRTPAASCRAGRARELRRTAVSHDRAVARAVTPVQVIVRHQPDPRHRGADRAAHPRRHPRRRHRRRRTSPHLTVPESYRAATVHKDEVDMFEGLASKEKDPRKSLHVEDVPLPELGPGRGAGRGDGQRDQLQHRVDLDLRAGVDVRLPRALRPAVAADQAARPALPRGRLRPVRRRAARPAPACTTWKPGDEVVAHCLSVELEEPGRPQRHDARPASSGSGASRPTSAAWPRSRWSSPTS